MKATKFTATLWVNAGYNHSNQNEESAIDIISKIWQDNAKKIFDLSGIYISASVKEARAVYHTDRWCPEWGEEIAEISGTRNPEFMQDTEKYKQMVLNVLSLCQKQLNQTTAQVEFNDIEFIYLKESMTEEEIIKKLEIKTLDAPSKTEQRPEACKYEPTMLLRKLNISERAINWLKSYDITTLWELFDRWRNHHRKNFEGMKNLWKKTYIELREFLNVIKLIYE